MKTEAENLCTLDVNELIKSLIGPWPTDTRQTNAADGGASALRDLGRGVRRALENVLQVGEREDLCFRLYGYSTRAEKPLVTALAWALAMPYRRARELPYAPLVLADASAAPPHRRIDRRIRSMAIDELVEQLCAPPKKLLPRSGASAPLVKQFPAAVMLGALFGAVSASVSDLKLDDGRRHEDLARKDFERIATEAIRHYTVMRERDTTFIELTSETDVRKVEVREVRAGLVATLLAAALLAASGHNVAFTELLSPMDDLHMSTHKMETGANMPTLH